MACLLDNWSFSDPFLILIQNYKEVDQTGSLLDQGTVSVDDWTKEERSSIQT
jgi:hypothetical protein